MRELEPFDHRFIYIAELRLAQFLELAETIKASFVEVLRALVRFLGPNPLHKGVFEICERRADFHRLSLNSELASNQPETFGSFSVSRNVFIALLCRFLDVLSIENEIEPIHISAFIDHLE